VCFCEVGDVFVAGNVGVDLGCAWEEGRSGRGWESGRSMHGVFY
jgi:hypothetical protein